VPHQLRDPVGPVEQRVFTMGMEMNEGHYRSSGTPRPITESLVRPRRTPVTSKWMCPEVSPIAMGSAEVGSQAGGESAIERYPGWRWRHYGCRLNGSPGSRPAPVRQHRT
jgi:hypothetical protein